MSIIQKHCLYLVENVKLDLASLVKAEVMTAEEARVIDSSSFAQNYLLLKHLVRSHIDRFYKFMEFVRAQQPYIYSFIYTGPFSSLHTLNVV